MAIKISNTDVINNSRKGIFQSVNFGSYTPANRPGTASAGDVIYNSTLESLEYWTGSSWLTLADEKIVATGGAEFTPGDGYKYHVFTSSTDFTISSGASSIQALIVAGGGGGGAGRSSGGGGAGGLRVINVGKRTSGTYPIVVGGGGAAMGSWTGYPLSTPHTSGGNGGNSSAFGFTSTGGGTAIAPLGSGSSSGGSGCGAKPGATVGPGSGNSPPVSPPQGNPGGAGAVTYPGDEYQNNGGGGGGSSAAGGSATASPTGPWTKGPGGDGSRSDNFSNTTPVVWNIPTSYGTPGPQPGRYFAGGGGAGGGYYRNSPGGLIAQPAPGGAGGAGGGGAGSIPAGGNATANTGGGGGGGLFALTTNYAGGSGGSGIVVVRYKI